MVLIKAFYHLKKCLVLVLLEQTQNFVWIYIIKLIIVIFLLMGIKSLNLKLTIKLLNFPTQFCPGSTSNEFCNTEFEEVSLNGNIYDFSLDYNSIDKSDILHIHKYLMTKNNMK